jgi:peptidyl-prolyl cis-trans isomerase A (cyclophilin A)
LANNNNSVPNNSNNRAKKDSNAKKIEYQTVCVLELVHKIMNRLKFRVWGFLLVSGILSLSACKPTYPKVVIQTALGNITAEIYIEQAPITAGNFLSLVEAGIYHTNASFYRVTRNDNQPDNAIKIDVIQGGLRNTQEKPLTPIRHETTRETGLQHVDGSLSMARREPGTADSEFFICIGAQPELDFGGKRNPDGMGFAVFGRVIAGMDIVRKIQQQEDKNQYLVEPVQILSIKQR